MRVKDMVLDFAYKAHGSQMYGDEPYSKHLEDVVAVLQEFGVADPDLLAAGYLHDVVEDTPVTLTEIRDLFGDRVANLVYAVTSEPGPNRKAKFALTAPKILEIPGALTIKLADRIANVRASRATSPRMFKMYKKEHPAFKALLMLSPDPMVDCLDKLFQE